MIKIDGSKLEGGGQIVRTSVGMSALTGKPVNIFNIRKGRCTSGLAEQHLQAVRAVASLCRAEVYGDFIGSHQITFTPGREKERTVRVRIRTAGSVGLVLQALAIPLFDSEHRVKIDFRGGATSGKWAPPIDYFEKVAFPVMSLWGFKKPAIKVERRGFYPKGGARVKTVFQPSTLNRYDLVERGSVKEIGGLSVASRDLEPGKVAERQKKGALSMLAGYDPKIKTVYAESDCPGTVVNLWAEMGNTVIGANRIGEKGLRAEDVGRTASEQFLKNLKGIACVDEHMTDQVMPLLAIAGGSVRIPEVTLHARTNMWVIKKFLGKTFEVKQDVVRARKKN